MDKTLFKLINKLMKKILNGKYYDAIDVSKEITNHLESYRQSC